MTQVTKSHVTSLKSTVTHVSHITLSSDWWLKWLSHMSQASSPVTRVSPATEWLVTQVTPSVTRVTRVSPSTEWLMTQVTKSHVTSLKSSDSCEPHQLSDWWLKWLSHMSQVSSPVTRVTCPHQLSDWWLKCLSHMTSLKSSGWAQQLSDWWLKISDKSD